MYTPIDATPFEQALVVAVALKRTVELVTSPSEGLLATIVAIAGMAEEMKSKNA
jgi:hypothetical protein